MAQEAQEDSKRALIAAAAINVFSATGFARTSMASIANEADMSRPALYQYFQNKGDIFGYAFTALVEGAADDALAALEQEGSVADQLDGFLQNFDGAFWERTSASPYGDELLSAKSEYAPRAVGTAMARIRRGLESYLKQVGPPGRSTRIQKKRQGWIDMLEYSPRGFKLDRPSIGLYRQRLSALAKSIAADCEMELRSV
ncbi:MAG: TetR family transcriptional regulator [Myxococcota bacterium]|nr:TetR family transcriptional regulator [Myxococcota bacterium]